jgi:hypothetical protein
MNDKQRAGLARDLQRAIARVAPDWTDSDADDPGVTMLQLFAFLLDDLQHRLATLDPQTRLLAHDVAARAATLAAALDGASDDRGGGLTRVVHFTGMVPGTTTSPPADTAPSPGRSQLIPERQRRRHWCRGTGRHGQRRERDDRPPRSPTAPAANLRRCRAHCPARHGWCLLVMIAYRERSWPVPTPGDGASGLHRAASSRFRRDAGCRAK